MFYELHVTDGKGTNEYNTVQSSFAECERLARSFDWATIYTIRARDNSIKAKFVKGANNRWINVTSTMD